LFRRHICIDVEGADEILKILKIKKYKLKFDYIAGRILEQNFMYYDDYQQIDTTSDGKITEMRFFPNGDNCRIYCKEETIDGGTFCIIMAKVIEKKKSQKLNKKIRPLIDTLKTYKYDLEK
jgi:hypothetical protein